MLKNLTDFIKLEDASKSLIKEVQQCLIDGGFLPAHEKADGLYGPITKKAFEEFKKSIYLGELAFIGEDTAEKLLTLKPQQKNTKLDVDYFYQKDNSTKLFGTGDRQCKLTCSAMLAHHLLKRADLKDLRQMQVEGGYREPESVYASYLKKYGDTIYNAPHVKALRDLNITAHYSKEIQLEDIVELLNKNIPVPLSVDYKKGGHIILAVGFNPETKRFWMHDPFGRRAGAAHRYSDRSPLAGKYDVYSWGLMEKLYTKYWNRHALVATKVGDLHL